MEQTTASGDRQNSIKQSSFRIMVEQAGAKLAQDRVIEAKVDQLQAEQVSGSQGALLLPRPLRTGRAPLNASGSSKPYAVRRSAPVTLGQLL